jgi:glycosyltransferase involved in cell wall biosynthesis
VADGARAFQSGVWIDLTRILTRVGQAAPTGIDRVELAWARHLLENSRGLHGVCRTTRGFLLLRPDGIRALLSMLSEAGAGTMRADRWSRITGRGDRPRHKAEAALRPLAIDRAPPWGLQAMARRYRPSIYLNLGHSNHSARVLRPMRQCGARVVVLIHDLIPLTHPDIVPPKQPARFARRIAQVRAHASLVVAVSGDTENALRAHWPDGPAPPIVRAEIGVEVPDPPVAAKSARGRFLMVGTLEPRKNHAVVLDAWEGLAGDMGRSRSRGCRYWVSRAGAGRRSPRESAPIRDMARRSSSTPPRATGRSAPPIPRPIRFSTHRWRRGSAFRRTRHWIAVCCQSARIFRHLGRVWATPPFTLTQGTSILGRKR